MRIIKRTELPDAVVVVTARQRDPNLIRPFVTFTVTPTCRYAQHLGGFVTEAAALQAHERMVREMSSARRQ